MSDYSADVHARTLQAMDRVEAGLCSLCGERPMKNDETPLCRECSGDEEENA